MPLEFQCSVRPYIGLAMDTEAAQVKPIEANEVIS
jgi:hypothetical protein